MVGPVGAVGAFEVEYFAIAIGLEGTGYELESCGAGGVVEIAVDEESIISRLRVLMDGVEVFTQGEGLVFTDEFLVKLL